MDYIYYFAYGSNLNLKQMKIRCPEFKLIKAITLDGYRLIFRSVADIEKDSNSKVEGVIFMISNQDERNLDKHEGVPNIYRKEYFNCIIDNNEESVLYYKMNSAGIGKPTNKYYNAIQEGYLQNNLDISILKDALKYSISNKKEPIFFSAKWRD